MDLLSSILNARNGDAVSQLANQFGLREDQTTSAIQNLLPALAGGLQRNISQGGLDALLGALSTGQHQRYLDDASTALNSETVRQDGNGILGHILGTKDMSRQVAAQAASRTGISESVLKQMLPAIAAMAMGALSKQTSTSHAAAGAGGGAGILGMLTPFLDRDRDGSIADDILGGLSNFFKK
jgi:hypothetical protein